MIAARVSEGTRVLKTTQDRASGPTIGEKIDWLSGEGTMRDALKYRPSPEGKKKIGSYFKNG